MFGQDRNAMRQVFFNAWKKSQDKDVLEPLEALIVGIIERHSEYHVLMNNPAQHMDKDYDPSTGETNPFLHMAMHLAVTEQLHSQRPQALTGLYQQLATKFGDSHQAEHQIMECLSESIWQAQRNQQDFNEGRYLDCIKSKT
ncbi:MAG: DUF1841 family protein [Gammaproteobacteria bacterium]|nr:DUF1841 family protein [Gammaproteobacteria bacterium]